MAWKLPAGMVLDTSFGATKVQFHIRNVCTYKKGKGYGLKLILSKVSTPDVTWIVRVCTAVDNKLWISLYKALGFPTTEPAKNPSLTAVISKMTELDRLTLIGSENMKTAAVVLAENDPNSPSPIYLSQCFSQRKMLLDVTDVLAKGPGGDLNLVRQWGSEFALKTPDHLNQLNEEEDQ